MTKQDEIREGIAEKAHLIWQRWMASMLTNLNDEHIEGWKRQANTFYSDLSEREKESDRAIADQYLEYLHSQGVVIKVERELEEIKKQAWRKHEPLGCGEYNNPANYARNHWDAYECEVAQAKERIEMMGKAGYVAVEPLIIENKVT